MTALAANNLQFARQAKRWGESKTTGWPVADGVYIYIGALLGLSDDGYVGPLSTTYRYGFVGVANEEVDNSGGSNGDKYVSVITPPFESDLATGILQDVTFAVTQMGNIIWCNTDNIDDVTLVPDAVTDTPLGMIGKYSGDDSTNPLGVFWFPRPVANGGLAQQTLAGNVSLITAGAATSGEIRLPTPPLDGIIVLDVDPDGSARTVTLPAAATAAGAGIKGILINNFAGGAEVVTVTDGTLSITPTQAECAWVVTDGARWLGGVMAAS